MIRELIAAAMVLTATPLMAAAQTPPAGEDWSLTDVAVVKTLPGPALWKVVRDDKVVWIIGYAQIDGKAAWDSTRIENILTGAETLYLPPAAVGGVSIIYRVMKDKDLPGKTTLKTVVSETEYARFRQTAQKHGVKTADIEKDKPLWAGMRLMMAVNKKYGYSSSTVVQRLTKAAKKKKVKVSRVATYEIKPLLTQLNGIDAEEARRCLMASLDSIDYTTATTSAATAAWVKGDVARLRPIVRGNPKGDCLEGLSRDLNARTTADTVGVIEKAMTGARRSVLVLPMHMLVADDRLVAELRRRGFQVREPK